VGGCGVLPEKVRHYHLAGRERRAARPSRPPWFQGDLFSASHEVIDIPWTSSEQRAFAPTGSFTPSAKASQEKGQRYHDYMVEQVVAFIEWLRSYRGPIGAVKSGIAQTDIRPTRGAKNFQLIFRT
jgi:hypothetical protein